MKFKIYRKRLNRGIGGDIIIFVFLSAAGIFTALPLVFAISNAFKPLNELFLFPPQFFVRNPTLQNFSDLFILMNQSWIPLTRYISNSLLIVILGMVGNLFFGSLAAFALSKHNFFGKHVINRMIVFSLMFAPAVVRIPNYLTIAFLGWIDTYWAVIVPAWASTLGLYLLRNFIDAMVPESLLESARLDGASEFNIYWRIVMPIVKPAWLTLIILTFQQLWGLTGSEYIYSEALKPLPYALNQLVQGGVARQGVGSAAALLMMLVPITVFIINQSQIVETMGHSGIK
ncbi:MAG: carbohydrate ABC transporter permease [Candidatus Wallacebacter cryptica]|jgi:ABC-type glycerol-3-phosphate transport system permease component|nr:carbohydrate ABC transporter permease [Bacillota bacterium]